MYEKQLTLSGIAVMVLSVIAIIYGFLPLEGDANLFLILAALIGALAFTPIFFINHKKKRDAFKVPCYITSAIISGLLMIGGLLAGTTKIFGEPNIYTGIFLLVCYLAAIMFFKPITKQKILVFLMVILMIGGLLAEQFLEKAL